MSAPVDQTCPDVDSAIKHAEELRDELLRSCPEQTRWVSRTANRLVDLLEDLRKSNERLREWGQEQETRADRADAKVTELESDAEDLRDLVADLEDEVARLHPGVPAAALFPVDAQSPA